MEQTEEILQKAFAQEGLAAPADAWEPLTGGRSNAVWKVGSGPKALVCKLYSTGEVNPIFPNLPGAEYDTLKTLSAQNLAPAPVALLNTKAGDVLVYRHLVGTTWRSGTPEVADLLAKLHQISPPELRVLPSGSKALLTQTKAILATLDGQFSLPDWLLRRDAVPPTDRRALLHTDVVPGNIIATEQGLRLIDWQSPALGDPAEDIASFLSPAMQILYRGAPLTAPEEMAFLTKYPDQVTLGRYHQLAPFYQARVAAYCCWKLARGAKDYAAAFEAELARLKRCEQGQYH